MDHPPRVKGFSDVKEAVSKAVAWLVNDVFKARWIVSLPDDKEPPGELGLRIAGVNLWYYKWPTPMVDSERPFRNAYKREFGESIASKVDECNPRRVSGPDSFVPSEGVRGR